MWVYEQPFSYKNASRRCRVDSIPKRVDGLRCAPPVLRVFSWFQGVPKGHEELS